MSTVVALLGPIKYWWDENWETNEHHRYAAHRANLSKALVDAGFLVYRPHEAFKGAWDERAQEINDFAILTADVSLVMNVDPEILSDGTDLEIEMLDREGRLWFYCPPGSGNIEATVDHLKSLKTKMRPVSG